ncbi:MAG: hypothetical protein ACYDAR_18970 [Thermomicrobiales bacterium]
MSATHARRCLPLALLALIILAMALVPVSLPVNDTIIPEGGNMRPVGEITAGVTVTEQFPAATNIASLSLLLSTYQRVNPGMLRITILAETGGEWQERAARDLDTMTLPATGYTTLLFSPPVAIRNGQHVRITLQSDNPPGQAVTWVRNPQGQRQDYLLTMNGQALPGNVIFQVSYRPDSGRLFRMIGAIWSRVTVFLNPLWQVVLIVGLVILAASVLALMRRLDDG